MLEFRPRAGLSSCSFVFNLVLELRLRPRAGLSSSCWTFELVFNLVLEFRARLQLRAHLRAHRSHLQLRAHLRAVVLILELDFRSHLQPICVWCWHHIMEMAEKEGSDGRCPACRTTYDKQRIVGMSANCKRMVAEISAEKKQKPQKAKNKSSSAIEDRKHLSSVRVVQRNLVYIMGMPSNLADESVLERKEYFGQYGKVLKVSVSRQAGTTPQQVA
ncbi:putative general negative regulator of transcription C16C9.04c [Asparagus officinalis]|uniref:putative general negative regulator of transcription C16C9.04c n=1 Tax=Asparagus officinalis TaxID=4686 RepID=UPI00098E1137|nr:putative general negative regulator of transcription C16C9.04c [Asparagus officinalis]